MSEHTEGPWEFDGVCQIVEAARPHMRVCFLPSDHHEYASSVPNGHLIAAAPDMLEAIETYLEVFTRSTRGDEEVSATEFAEARNGLRRAIAKVRQSSAVRESK